MSECFSKLFRDKISLKLPEKADREMVIKWLLENDDKLKKGKKAL